MPQLFFWWFLLLLSMVYGQDPVANLPQGRVVGIKVFSENSLKPIEVFYGIPYASPPTGRLRFSPPERHTGWRRTLFAHRMPSRCHQSGNDTDNFSEDCLYVNIWTPRRVDGKLQPVLIILYSDSWTQNGITLPCQELAAEGLVVVTVAYRLHILAFFTLKSIAARGNLALLDQYMALLWVRENIATFGGDPNAITLLGQSAGADSILYHIISPRTVGIFQRAIIMSPHDIWKAVEKDSDETWHAEKLSRLVTESLGCIRDTDNEILRCLRARPVSDLITSVSSNWTNAIHPTIDDYLPESEQYLPTTISAALSSSKFPNIQLDILLGTTDLESIDYDFDYEEVARQGTDNIYEYASIKIIPEILSLLSLDRAEISPTLAQAIRWEFLGPKVRRDNVVNIHKLIEAVARMETSAKWGAGCALLAARLARRVSHLYVYHYSQPTGTDLWGRKLNFTGATYGAEIIALLGNSLMLQIARRPTSQSEKQMSEQFRKHITNFVKFGAPDNLNEWPRYMVGDSYINEICKKEDNDCNRYKTSRDIAFWLQYLPRLSHTLASNGQAEKIATAYDGSRLRGGVVAMCGVSVILLLLLCASVILLHRWRTHRPFNIDSHVAL